MNPDGQRIESAAPAESRAAAAAGEIPRVDSGTVRPRPWKVWLVHLIKAAVAVTLLWLLVRTIRIAALEEAVAGANGWFMLAAFALMPVNLWLQGRRWWCALRGEMPGVPFSKVFASFLGGMSLGLITPGRVGEIGRVFLLQPPSRVRLAGLHVLDKAYFMGVLVFFGPALVYHTPGFSDYLSPGLRVSLLIATSALPVLYFSYALTPVPLRRLLAWLQKRLPLKGSAADLLHALDRVEPRDSRRMAAITAGQFVVVLTQFHLLSNAFQAVNWLTAAHTYTASLFVKTLLPISLGDLGVSEWATVSIYHRFEIADTTAFTASLLIFTINILLPAIAGFFVLQKVKATNVFGRITRRMRRRAG
ncbi:MAG: hypothetical protein MAG453_01784 [Calditrichaeota bacterium]|nr:hypothetical protein [Calditrichota bacterium]